MECERAATLLSALIDSALGPIARLRVHRHVAGCGTCAARLEELRAMRWVVALVVGVVVGIIVINLLPHPPAIVFRSGPGRPVPHAAPGVTLLPWAVIAIGLAWCAAFRSNQ